MKALSAATAAEMLGGELIRGEGVTLTGPGSPEDAAPGSFVYASGRKSFLAACSCGAALILSNKVYSDTDTAVLLVAEPRGAFVALLRYFEQEESYPPGISPLADVRPSAVVHPDAYVAPFVRVGSGACLESGVALLTGAIVGDGVRIASGTVVRERAVLHSGTELGRNVDIGTGSVIGAPGFGYEQSSSGWERVPQLGGVLVEEGVRIGCNCTVDRATAGRTVIGRGSRIDNLVHVAHNVVIGPDNLILAQAGIAGSVTTGSGCIIGGQVGIADHCRIGDRVVIGSKSGVQRHALKSDTMYWGNPAREMGTSKKINAAMKDLPAIAADWRKRNHR